MGVGGATWDTAGTLELGSGNTFDRANATETDRYVDQAWWVYTPAVSLRVGITDSQFDEVGFALYKGADEASKEFVFDIDFEYPATVIYHMQAGVTYHLLVGQYEGADADATYQVTFTATPLAATPWKDTLRDRDDNFVIVSREGYSLHTVDQPWQSWMETVIRRRERDVVHSARVGTYGATEVLGGDDPNDADGCCWAHVLLGEVGAQLWNGGGGAGDTSPATCRPLGVFPIGYGAASDTNIGYTVHPAGSPIPFIARVESARIRLDGRAIYLRPIHDNLPPQGRLNPPNQTDDGVPDEAVLEWETDRVDLVSAFYTADNSGSWPDEGEAGPDAVTVAIAMRDVVRASYFAADDDYDFWPAGTPGEWDVTQGDQYLYGQWLDGDRDWVEITGLIAGDDGTDNLAELNDSDAPDENATIGPTQAWGAGFQVDGTHDREADVALKVYVRSPRYRWVYESTTRPFPPRRLGPRHNMTTAARGVGGRDNIQDGPRGSIGGVT